MHLIHGTYKDMEIAMTQALNSKIKRCNQWFFNSEAKCDYIEIQKKQILIGAKINADAISFAAYAMFF